jgi:hypothetical protein
MFTAPLLSNARGADHRKHRSCIIAPFRFQGNVLAEPLPSSELFTLSVVMSHCSLLKAIRSEWSTGVPPFLLFLALCLRRLCLGSPSFPWLDFTAVFTLQPLQHLSSDRVSGRIFGKSIGLEIVKRAVGISSGLRKINDGTLWRVWSHSETEKETAHRVRAGSVGAPATLGSFAHTDWKNRMMVITLDRLAHQGAAWDERP